MISSVSSEWREGSGFSKDDSSAVNSSPRTNVPELKTDLLESLPPEGKRADDYKVDEYKEEQLARKQFIVGERQVHALPDNNQRDNSPGLPPARYSIVPTMSTILEAVSNPTVDQDSKSYQPVLAHTSESYSRSQADAGGNYGGHKYESSFPTVVPMSVSSPQSKMSQSDASVMSVGSKSSKKYLPRMYASDTSGEAMVHSLISLPNSPYLPSKMTLIFTTVTSFFILYSCEQC